MNQRQRNAILWNPADETDVTLKQLCLDLVRNTETRLNHLST